MRFYEYEAKALFAKHNTPLLKGRVAKTPAEATLAEKPAVATEAVPLLVEDEVAVQAAASVAEAVAPAATVRISVPLPERRKR